jgi:tagatose 1,6-diphosphate aldolase
MQLSPGKLWGMRRMADGAGRFKMTAADQRPPIKNPIAAHYGTDEAPYEDVARFKALLTEILQDGSSAMLLDPHYAIPAGIGYLSPAKGLIVTLEDSLFEETEGGRLSSEIDDWSVAKIKRMGGDAVKVLAWYRPDVSDAVKTHQKDFTKRIGAACASHDIPFLFELLVYPLASDAHQTKDYVELQGKKTDDVLASVEEFTKPDYGVDVFKLESPLNAKDVPGVGNEGWEEAQKAFDEMGRLAGRPWVMLSAGAGKADFRNILTHAYRAGASGYLAGRAIWLDAFAHFPDWDRIRQSLATDSVNYMKDLNALTDAVALPWHDHPVFAGGGARFSPADASFRHSYADFGS